MKQTITELMQIAARADSIDTAAATLSKNHPRLSKGAAKNVMLDVQDHVTGEIDETKLSLFLKQHGF